jgi:hypothetical protein
MNRVKAPPIGARTLMKNARAGPRMESVVRSRRKNAVGRADAVLVKHAEKIRTLLRRTGRDVIEIGKLLKDARKRLQHVEWLPWLQEEFRMSPDMAERFINVHTRLGKYRNMRNLPPPTVLYELAKPSTPEETRTEIMQRAQAGERISTKEAKTVTVGVGRITKLGTTMAIYRPSTQLVPIYPPKVEPPPVSYIKPIYPDPIADAAIREVRRVAELRSTPGTMPLTSQLALLISTTTTKVERPPLRATTMKICGRGGRMLAARVEQHVRFDERGWETERWP